MLFYKNLEDIVFGRHEVVPDVDQLIIISGYVGPQMIKRLQELPFQSRVIYGMYGESGVGRPLHNALVNLEKNLPQTDIYYSKIPVHAKCYMWMHNHKIQHALVGSANFSANGLHNDYREVLAETTRDTFQPLLEYTESIMNEAILCTDNSVDLRGGSSKTKEIKNIVNNNNPDVCSMTLLDRNGNTPEGSGINWGFSKKGHNSPGVSYIPIRTSYIRMYPRIFKPKQTHALSFTKGAKPNRQNDAVELIWDDGTEMEGLLEGSQPVDGLQYPKNLSSSPDKKQIGAYLRRRLHLPSDIFVTKKHLEDYGRTTIDISRIGDGIYYLDFSTKKKS